MTALQSPTRTKVVATIGPSCNQPDTLAHLLAAGVNVCRLNFSHGDLQDHARVLSLIRDWAAAHDRPIAVLGDLSGPKIRLNRVQGGSAELASGALVRFVRGSADATPDTLTCNYPTLIDELRAGQRLYIDDGLLRLLVRQVSPDEALCEVLAGGVISDRKGLNLPDTQLSTPALTEKDRRDAQWALENQLDFVALSFVRRPADVVLLRELLDHAPDPPHLIIKVEMVEALEHLDELVALADGVMVARGDLGVQMDVWQVPLVQKSLTARCRQLGKPVIIATQMLQSMVAAPSPTRAEVSDVANAILDRADAVMLSGETASGRFPVQAVQMMGNISRATEAFLDKPLAPDAAVAVDAGNPTTSAIADAAVQAALHLRARLVAVWTATGRTVRWVAQHRLPLPVVGLTNRPRVYHQMNLLHGVIPQLVPPMAAPQEMSQALDELLVRRGLVNQDDLIIVVTSTRPTISGETDTVLVHRVGAP